MVDRLKQVILIRRDLNMRRGKEIAQGAHASGDCLFGQLRQADDVEIDHRIIQWVRSGMAKVCLQVADEAELMQCFNQAREQGLLASLITDSGRTEFAGVATRTACAIGPDHSAAIDNITGKLKLY